MGLGAIGGEMGGSMWGSILMTRRRDLVNISGLMEGFFRENGKMEKKMGKGKLFIPLGMLSKENGRMMFDYKIIKAIQIICKKLQKIIILFLVLLAIKR